jgi:hypothetical protein
MARWKKPSPALKPRLARSSATGLVKPAGAYDV